MPSLVKYGPVSFLGTSREQLVASGSLYSPSRVPSQGTWFAWCSSTWNDLTGHRLMGSLEYPGGLDSLGDLAWLGNWLPTDMVSLSALGLTDASIGHRSTTKAVVVTVE